MIKKYFAKNYFIWQFIHIFAPLIKTVKLTQNISK